MRVKVGLTNLVAKSLSESMNVKTMVVLIRKFAYNYDLNKATGFPQNIPIPNRDAARQIVNDIIKLEYFPHFINLLVDIHYNGLTGKRYNISYLREIIREMMKHGLIYDQSTSMFVEDSNIQKTRNWGVLREGDDVVFTFLRLDIVSNSTLVKNHEEKIIKKTYNDLRKIVEVAIDKRNGRIWSWEGDGGLIAFHFGKRDIGATLSAIEILHEIFLYNQFKCKLKKDLEVRFAIHDGSCEYSHNEENIEKNETIKYVKQMESKYTKPNTITISDMVHAMLDHVLVDQFKRIKSDNRKIYYNYSIKWEK